jgi:hypothetical protein
MQRWTNMPPGYKGKYVITYVISPSLEVTMVRSLVVDFEALIGRNKELLIKELAMVGKNFVQTYHFASPYS